VLADPRLPDTNPGGNSDGDHGDDDWEHVDEERFEHPINLERNRSRQAGCTHLEHFCLLL
jgi:hypothetical protein